MDAISETARSYEFIEGTELDGFKGQVVDKGAEGRFQNNVGSLGKLECHIYELVIIEMHRSTFFFFLHLPRVISSPPLFQPKH